MMSFPFHIVIAPILLPLITAALLLFFDERQRVAKAAISLTSTVLLLVVAILLFREVNSTVNTEIAAVVSSVRASGWAPAMVGSWSLRALLPALSTTRAWIRIRPSGLSAVAGRIS